MRPNKILSILAVATFVVLASTRASAQGSFGFGYSKFGKHSAVGVGFQSGGFYPRHGGAVVVERAPVRHWVRGYYETRCVEVWVPGSERRVWVEPVYQTVAESCGNVVRVLVRPGHFKVIRDAGHYETQHVQVWVPGHYA